MKLINIVNASSSLRKLSSQDINLKTAYELYKLVNMLNPHLAYFDNNKERIVELADNNNAELDALLQEEIELPEYKKVVVSLDEDAKISAIDIISLEEFVEFKTL